MNKTAVTILVCFALTAFLAVCAAMSIIKTREAIREAEARKKKAEEAGPEEAVEPEGTEPEAEDEETAPEAEEA